MVAHGIKFKRKVITKSLDGKVNVKCHSLTTRVSLQLCSPVIYSFPDDMIWWRRMNARRSIQAARLGRWRHVTAVVTTEVCSYMHCCTYQQNYTYIRGCIVGMHPF